MDDQLFQRIFIINFQQIFKFPFFFHSQPGLYGNPDITFTKNLIQKSVQFIRPVQKSCSTASGHHCLRRTAQIQIHFLIPIFFQSLHCSDKILRIFGKYLRNRLHSLIILRCNIFLFYGAQMSFLIWQNKWNKIFVESAKAFLQRTSVCISCHSLQRG